MKSLLLLLLFTYSIFLEATVLQGHKSNWNGVDYVYQLPLFAESSSTKLNGVIFLAHGCGHASTDWWPKGESCSTCIGLPVEQSIVKESLLRGFAVLAVSSTNLQHKCWSHPDIQSASSVINLFYDVNFESHTKPPLFLFGASSGGSFVGHLAASNAISVPVQAICVQISATQEVRHIPVIYLLMERDAHTLHMVKDSWSGSPGAASESRKILTCAPKPIEPNFFFDRGGVDNKEISEAIQKALLSGGFLFSDTLLLKENPRMSDWRSVVEPVLVGSGRTVSLVADESPISELLNVAWAAHEITAEYLPEVFDWFNTHTNSK